MSDDRLREVEDVLKWIATVNAQIDLRKLDRQTLIGLIYELRAKAQKYCDSVRANGND